MRCLDAAFARLLVVHPPAMTEHTNTLSLCLSAVGQERKIVSIDKNASLQQLYELARSSFSTRVSLKHGFPPQSLQDSPTITLPQAGIQDKDRIIVNLVDKNASKAPPIITRTQRAAAKAASDSFGEVIRAQDKLLMQESNDKSSKRKQASTFNDNKNKKKKSKSLTLSNFASLPAGRRLQDGSAAVASPPSRLKRSKKTSSGGSTLKNEEDVSVALMNALNGGNGGGKVGQVLRGAMKSAITNRYAASRAVSKVSAVQSKQYTITEQDGMLSISYSKGLEGRGMFEEQVENIPRDALEAVIKAIHQNDEEREMLRPSTLAQVSPRVFWNLVHLYGNTCNAVEECLQTLLPQLDWSFFQKRKTKLSSKALENLRQEQQDNDDALEQNEEAAQEAVQAVEDAMTQLSQYNAEQRRERAARAAMARHDNTTATAAATTDDSNEQDSSAWQLIIPTEPDDDELQECIATTVSNDDEGNSEMKRILAALHSLNIYNWRQLANASVDEISKTANMPTSQVESWLDHAQAQSVEELMVEVCDGRMDVVEKLRDEARTGTIKDLANWHRMPDLLYSSVPSFASMDNVQVSTIQTWCRRAQAILEQYEWVHWYATPVE